jgi:hypothetical protein
MPQSLLKRYIEIVKTLSERGPLNICELAILLKRNPSSLNRPVTFLRIQKMIREQSSDSVGTYIITKRGTKILKFFNVQPLIKLSVDKN